MRVAPGITGDGVFNHRDDFLSHIIKLSLTMIPQQRTYGAIVVREDEPDVDEPDLVFASASSLPPAFLENIPFTV